MSDAPMVDLVYLCKDFDREGSFLMSNDELREKYEKKIVFYARRVVAEADGLPEPEEEEDEAEPKVTVDSEAPFDPKYAESLGIEVKPKGKTITVTTDRALRAKKEEERCPECGGELNEYADKESGVEGVVCDDCGYSADD